MKEITSIEQLTLQWITEILREKEFLQEGFVTRIIVKNIQKTNRCNIHFLELEFSTVVKMTRPLTEIVVKDYRPGFKLAQKLKSGVRKEMQFYQTLAYEMKTLPILTCYYSNFSENPFDSLLILENVSKTHSELLSSPETLTKSHVKSAIKSLAQIHAFWWEHTELEDIAPKNDFNENIRLRDFITIKRDKYRFFAFYKRVGKILLQWLKVAGDSISKERIKLYKECYLLYPEELWRRVHEKKNLTLIHGDAHPYQFYYPKNLDNSEFKAILGDWEAWSINIGIFDLSYMIGLFLTPEMRVRWNERELIEHYHQALLHFGVKKYSFDDCYYDFRMGLINNFYIPIWNMNVNMFRKNAVLAFEDFNCMELLKNIISN